MNARHLHHIILNDGLVERKICPLATSRAIIRRFLEKQFPLAGSRRKRGIVFAPVFRSQAAPSSRTWLLALVPSCQEKGQARAATYLRRPPCCGSGQHLVISSPSILKSIFRRRGSTLPCGGAIGPLSRAGSEQTSSASSSCWLTTQRRPRFLRSGGLLSSTRRSFVLSRRSATKWLASATGMSWSPHKPRTAFERTFVEPNVFWRMSLDTPSSD